MKNDSNGRIEQQEKIDSLDSSTSKESSTVTTSSSRRFSTIIAQYAKHSSQEEEFYRPKVSQSDEEIEDEQEEEYYRPKVSQSDEEIKDEQEDNRLFYKILTLNRPSTVPNNLSTLSSKQQKQEFHRQKSY